MTLEEYKALAAKATAGDQQAIVDMVNEGERLFGVESTSQAAIAEATAAKEKAEHTNAQLMISMYGRTDPGSPAGATLPDSESHRPPEFYSEEGEKLTGVQYAMAYAEHCMAETAGKDE